MVWGDNLFTDHVRKMFHAGIQCADTMPKPGLVDLSQVWHPAEEEPESNRLLLVENIGGYCVTMKPESKGYGWRAFIRATEAKRWAYVEDLLPKGGEP